ncbi:MAG TPA: GntR family transcriptional regulator, partial [Clostridia bacterium]|nr:GntR family transcriptional regulator [Clostridia bacterium]
MEDKMAIDKNSVIPIYYQLAKFLENQIRQGKFQPGEALPTEMELAERFQI